MAVAAQTSFRVGKKELFLPSANITLLRCPLAPHFARFRVPLNFSKLDLRDYLWHVYSVPILSVRSYVKQQRVRQGDPENLKPQQNRWNRPRAQKYMTVELAQPFNWPEEPEDYKEWNAKEVQAGEKEQKAEQEGRSPTGDTIINETRREKMKEQARALLEGRRAWTPAVDGRNVNLLKTTKRGIGA